MSDVGDVFGMEDGTGAKVGVDVGRVGLTLDEGEGWMEEVCAGKWEMKDNQWAIEEELVDEDELGEELVGEEVDYRERNSNSLNTTC